MPETLWKSPACRSPWFRCSALLALVLLLGVREAAAVSVSPVALYLDQRNRTGTLTLFNPGSLPEEIEIGFAFGYPQSDSAGNVSVPFTEAAPADEPSATQWVRAFPRRLVLQPGQRHVVRVMIQPPAGLAGGEYWARVLVRARGGQPPIEQAQGNVQVQINVATVVVVALNYRNGPVATGLAVRQGRAERMDDQVVATVDLERQGNSAFLGRIRAELVDARGKTVAAAEDLLAVYHTIRRRLSLQVPPGSAGPFTLRLRMDTERDDLPPGGPIPAAPVTRTLAVDP